jgi:transcriptional regulator with XRE-family HTH domain
MQHIVEQIFGEAGVSKAALSRRAGLARSTAYRIREGSMDPTVGTLRELALAAGLDIELRLTDLSDPLAAQAARVMLDEQFDPQRVSGDASAVKEWVARLERWVPNGDPVEIVRAAGRSSSLLHRAGAIPLRGSIDELKAASAGAFSGSPWLTSGRSLLRRIRGEADDAVGTEGGPVVIYSPDPQRLERLLDHMKAARPEKADLIIAPYSDDLEQDAWSDGAIKLVAPIQGLIDAFGIGGALARRAESIARSWS